MIVGAGISGTPTAYYLQAKYNIEVSEQSNRLGGHATQLNPIGVY